MGQGKAIRFGLRAKLILILLLFTAAITALVSLSMYQVVDGRLQDELSSRVLATVKLGADSIALAPLARLTAAIRPDMDEEQTALLEASEDFRIVSDQLNRIRDTDPQVIRYVYTFVPTEQPGTALFAVDADVLSDLQAIAESRARGEETEVEEVSHIGSIFDITDFERAQAAIRERSPTLDEEYVWDEVFRVNSISGYAPILDGEGRLLAVLGVDMADVNARAALAGVTRLSLIIIAAAVVLGLAVSLLMGNLMTRDVIALEKTVLQYGRGDFSARSTIRTRDEVGGLARSFNDMVQTITEYEAKLLAAERQRAEAELATQLTGAREAESRKYLDNISQGLLMIDGQHRIGQQYSASLVRLFRCQDSPAGRDFVQFIYPDQLGQAAERAELTSFLGILIGNRTAEADMLEAVNPIRDRELRAHDGSLIVVDARFLPLARDGQVENIMVIFEDKSGIRAAERKLQEQRERHDAELEAIAAILKNGPVLFRDFVAGGEALTAELEASLGSLADRERSAHFMREFHSLKGSARSLQLAQLAVSAHRLEDLLLAARDAGGLSGGQLEVLGKALEATREGIRKVKETIERFAAFQAGDSSPQKELAATIASFGEMVGQLGRELGKEVVFEPDVRVAELPFLKELKNPIIHLLRNAVDHGVEDIYERTASGKPSAARIRLGIRREGSKIHIAVQDDGKGIDFERVRQKAVEKKLLPAEGELSREKLLKVLFSPGFSSKDGVSEISGRGVGLDVVRHAVQQLGGKVTVGTAPGIGAAFRLAIPLKRASDAPRSG